MPRDSTYPLIFDGHNDTILSMEKTGRSFFERAAEGHIDLPRAADGGLGGGFFAIYIRDPSVAERVSAGSSTSQDAVLNIYGDERTWPEPMALDYAQSTALHL
jgi:microsomal dipeptidase-like Zn-dependent dipeptidase